MNLKNGKRKIGLIALLSCVFTATVAFAAYTGYNYINGTVTVEGSPFKMVYADKDGNPVAETATGKIAAVDHATVNGSAATAQNVTDGILTDLSVSAFDGTLTSHAISNFTVKLSEVNDTIAYTFKIKNTGGAPAFLDAVDIAKTTMPKDSTNNDVTGLAYTIALAGVDSSNASSTFTLTSAAGSAVSREPSSGEYISVAPDATVEVTLTVKATDDNLFSAWNPTADDGQGGTGAYGATITLGKITITWSAVDPSQA